jgi:hypothetical protein
VMGRAMGRVIRKEGHSSSDADADGHIMKWRVSYHG